MPAKCSAAACTSSLGDQSFILSIALLYLFACFYFSGRMLVQFLSLGEPEEGRAVEGDGRRVLAGEGARGLLGPDVVDGDGALRQFRAVQTIGSAVLNRSKLH